MKICDAHVHLGESGPWIPFMKPTIRLEKLIQLFNQFDVEKAVVFPNPNVGDKYPLANDYIAQCVQAYPKRLIGFGRVDPRRGSEAIKELIRMHEKLQLKGLKLHPIVECFRPDHPFFEKLYKKVNELKMPILFHTGDGFASPSFIVKIAKKYPHTTTILGHLKEGCLAALKQSENIYVETSGAIPDIIELSVDIDDNRILFGSDIPYYRYPTQITTINAAKISNKKKGKYSMKISKNSSSRRETENSIQRGIYILIIHLTRDVKIKIGKIGTKPFTKGYYLYTGSAQGTTSSNLPNRLQRHLNRNKRKYWHIDFLLANKNVKIEQFITVSTTEKIECKINALLKRKLEATIPVKGFGATDCKQKCQSHLLFIGEKEKLEDSICLIMKEMSIKYNLPPNYIYK